ncbi:MAG: tRNA lysidine(34) synthetase TilS, partial [Clostridia bacterium]|nr:tRNA lysidine(34) synthetase TilS [Clostridia bacterium]
MIQKGDKICVALSGGADSVALLHVLYSLKDELDFSLSALHINHMLRGEESDRDERFA